jgi:hypothetical protein
MPRHDRVSTKQRNYNVDDPLNRNWYKILPQLRSRAGGSKEDGRWVTIEDRPVFIGGPGQGRATATSTPVDSVVANVRGGLSDDEAHALMQELKETWPFNQDDEHDPLNERFGVAFLAVKYATTSIDPDALEVHFIELRDSGDLMGVAALVRRDIGSMRSSSDYLVLEYMATRQPGYGRRLFTEVMQIAGHARHDLVWETLPSAKGFYNAMGFTPSYWFDDNGRTYRVSPREARGWLQGPFRAKVVGADQEPENGVFAVVLREFAGKEGRWVTIEDRPVFIGGPGQGGGSNFSVLRDPGVSFSTMTVYPQAAERELIRHGELLTREEYIVELCEQTMTAQQIAQVNDWLVDVPNSHLAGLQDIVLVHARNSDHASWLPDDIVLTEDGDFARTDKSGKTHRGIVATYYRENARVLLSPAGFRPNVLLHELGHHVTLKYPAIIEKAEALAWRYFMALRMSTENDSTDVFDDTVSLLQEAGLRPYSITSGVEFAADSYLTMIKGTGEQVRTLMSIWAHPYTDDRGNEDRRTLEEMLRMQQ